MHEGNEIWIADAENRLHIKKGTPIWGDRENIYFKRQVPAGCKLITSNFGFPVEGMQLKVVEEKTDNKLEDSTTESQVRIQEKKESAIKPELSAPGTDETPIDPAIK